MTWFDFVEGPAMLSQVICVVVMLFVGLLTGLLLAFLARDTNQRRARLSTVATVIGLGLLVVGSIVASFFHSSAEDAARAAYSSHWGGSSSAQLELIGGGGTWDPFGGQKGFVFKIKGSQPPQVVHVVVFQPAYFLPWEVMAVWVDTPKVIDH